MVERPVGMAPAIVAPLEVLVAVDFDSVDDENLDLVVAKAMMSSSSSVAMPLGGSVRCADGESGNGQAQCDREIGKGTL